MDNGSISQSRPKISLTFKLRVVIRINMIGGSGTTAIIANQWPRARPRVNKWVDEFLSILAIKEAVPAGSFTVRDHSAVAGREYR
jgi:hypothetical protein